jgi:hypothetical protein
MRTLKNRRKGKRTRRGGLIKKVKNEWTNVSGPSETQAVNEYRRMEEETMRLLAAGCQSEDSNECLRDEPGVLLAAYQEKCDAYQGHEDETTFSHLLSIKDTIGELIRLRVQDSGRFPVKLTDDSEQKRKRKAHRDRIDYWSTIYIGIKQIFDTVRQKRYDTRIANVKEEYERLKDLLDESQCKSIKDAYEQTAELIKVLEKEDVLMGNSNEAVIALLKARNTSKQELYEKASQMPQRRAQFSVVEKKMKELGLEEVEERTKQDRQSQMIKDSITRMDREQQRRMEQEEERVRREEKERIANEMAKEAARQKILAAQANQSKQRQKEAQEKQAVELAIQKAKEEEILGKWKFLASVSPFAMVSPEVKDKMKQYDEQIKRILQTRFTEEKIQPIKEITTRWEELLDEEAKTKKSAADRAAAEPTEASRKLESVEDVYQWHNIQDAIEVLPESELKTQLMEIDTQIDAMVYSSMDRIEMNARVKRLMDKGELLIERQELIKNTRQIHDPAERAALMRNNRVLDRIPELPIDEKHEQMKTIMTDWKEKIIEAHAMQNHREKLPPELFQRLVRLKEERKGTDPSDPRLKTINMHNGLLDKMIYKEPLQLKRIEEQIAKWELSS